MSKKDLNQEQLDLLEKYQTSEKQVKHIDAVKVELEEGQEFYVEYINSKIVPKTKSKKIKNDFTVHVFKDLILGEFIQLTGWALDNAGLEVGKKYAITYNGTTKTGAGNYKNYVIAEVIE